jgi:alpha-galactosidase
MLPVGHLGPAPGWGQKRNTRLTRDEQRTLLTLWPIFRSPLMIGGDLTATDEWTTASLTNPEVIAVDQHSTNGRPVITTSQTVAWMAASPAAKGHYVAVFNVGPEAQKLHLDWKELGLEAGTYHIRDLWERKDLGPAKSLDLTLPSHACVLYALAIQ